MSSDIENNQETLSMDYWWVSATLGVLVFLFCFKVEV
jgi:hypothetical protein